MMNRFTKTVLFALLLSIFPARIWAQDYRDYENGFLFNVFSIENLEERVQLASALATSDIWICNPTDNPGELYIRPNGYNADIPIYAEFDYLRMTLREEYEEASSLQKEEFAEIFNSWARNLSNEYYNFLISDQLDRANHCMNAEPFCTSDVYNFPALNSGTSWSGPDYGCLHTSPTTKQSFWYYMRIGVAGNITIKIEADFDVDFALWGPFSNEIDPCPTQAGQAGMLTATCSTCPNNTSSSANYPYGNLHDCSYDARHYEYAHVVNGQVGQYFILLITNFSGSSGSITFQKYAGDGETDCGIMPPMVDNDGPYCVGETINLTANGQAGASYSWTGPGGFTSNQQNPSRPSCTMAMAGTYTCTITVGSATNSADTEVVVYPQPTANFTATTVCQGEETQFTSTSTTNPAGQQITSYLWNFGDGQTSTQQNPTHVYPYAGSFTVTLTVSCGNGHCTSTKTQTVNVMAMPVANAGPDQTIPYGTTAQLTGSGGAGTFNFHWEPANKVVNANTQSTQTVVLTQTQTYTLTVSNAQGQCVDTDEVTIHISGGAMAVTAGPNIDICQGGSSPIYVSAGGGTGNFTYSWSPATGLSATNIANPTASPAQTTTYTCQVNDGQTTQTVSVTVTVNDVIEEHQYDTICPDDVYTWTENNTPYDNPGVYPYYTQTEQGCDKTVYLHLANYPTYTNINNPIEVSICPGDSYEFYGETYTTTTQTFYHDHTVHGCDSTIWLYLTVYEEHQVTDYPQPLCISQLPWVYEAAGDTLYAEDEGTHLYTLQDIHGCDSLVLLDLSISDYYVALPQVERLCYHDENDHKFTWDITGETYRQDTIVQVTIPYEDCLGIFKLDLEFREIPQVEHITVDDACDEYYWPISGQRYIASGTYDWSDPIPGFPCTRDYQLHLTVNKSHTDDHREFDGECDEIDFEWFGVNPHITMNGVYDFSKDNDHDGFTTLLGCDTACRVTVTNMKYTPNPTGISANDGSYVVSGDTIAVITETEFFSFKYEFSIIEQGNSIWDECIWSISKDSWRYEPTVAPNKKSSTCWVYVADRDNNLVELKCKIRNSCMDPGEYKEKTFYLKSSYVGVDEFEADGANINIVPNPNNGQMRINFEQMAGRVRVQVFDMQGNQVDAFETFVSSDNYSYEYNMGRYADGLYLFVISDNQRQTTRKVVITK